ncbi:hypothetical protein BH11ARM2_BH11ARM2_23620 [soil metagenome]
MQRTLKLALASVLGAMLVVPAFAQDNFPDVPDNHWAYEALLRMKSNGLLVGYPDGLFRGNRPASRYEMAVAIHATYVNLKNITDGLQAQIDALKAGNPDLQALRDAVTNLQNDVNNLKRYGDDIAALRRLTDTFQKELQDLNVDVEQMKKDLSDLNNRVTVLEAHKPTVDIHGDANLWIGAGTSTDGRFGLNKDGRVLGLTQAGLKTTNITRDLTVLHEGALRFTTTKETGPKFSGTVVVSNSLGDPQNLNPNLRTAFGDQSQVAGFYGSRYAEGREDVYIQDFGVKFDTSIAGLGLNANLGRVGYKISPYVFQRLDNTTYYSNDRWDDGKYIMDGGILGFNFGGAKLDIFGGRTSRRLTVDNIELQPYVTGAYGGAGSAVGGFQVDQTLGANLNVPLGQNGNVDVSYLFLDNNGVGKFNLPGKPPFNNNNRIGVFGATGDFKFGALKVAGGYSSTQLMYNNSNRNNKDNQAYYGTLGFVGDRWGIEGTYREVQAKFVAPGDWGRLGIIRNPQNIRGFQVTGHINVTDALALKASGEFDQGASNNFRKASYFDKDTRIDTFSVGLDYAMNRNLGLLLGYEEARFRNLVGGTNLNGTAQPLNPGADSTRYRWTTVGLGYGLSDAAKLSIAYEFSDHRNDFVVGNGALNNFKGGFFTTQLTVKF